MIIVFEYPWDDCLANYVRDNAAKYKDEKASSDLICCNKNLYIGHEHNTCEDEITALCITTIFSINGAATDWDCIQRKDCYPKTF